MWAVKFHLRRFSASCSCASSPWRHGRRFAFSFLRHPLRQRPSAQCLEHGPAARIRQRSGRRSFPLILDDYVLRQFLSTFALVVVSFVLAHAGLHFFRTARRHHPQSHPPGHGRRVPLNLTPSMIYTSPAGRTRRCARHLRHAQPHQRTHRDEGHRHQPLPRHRAHSRHRCRPCHLAFHLRRKLPAHANRRQEALRSIIKGKPAQTFLRPGQTWIFGHPGARQDPAASSTTSSSTPTTISSPTYPSSNSTPTSFALSRRIFADQRPLGSRTLYQWIFEDGWERDFNGEAVGSYDPFVVKTLPESTNHHYFKKENRNRAR